MDGLADGIRMLEMTQQDGVEGVSAQMGLVPQHNNTTGQPGKPAGPPGSSLNGTEHSQICMGIDDEVLDGKVETPKFLSNGFIVWTADHGDLSRLQRPPLRENRTNDGALPPRQEQFGATHAR